jgi:hypothetical protein
MFNKIYFLALSYCFGQAISSFKSLKVNARLGSLKDSLANKTKSAFPELIISSA